MLLWNQGDILETCRRNTVSHLEEITAMKADVIQRGGRNKDFCFFPHQEGTTYKV